MARPSTSLIPFRIRVQRAFKALDDGVRKKWVVVIAARDLPVNMPLDANARVPNIVKNGTCLEMRETLLWRPELFQILNSGIVCTAASVEVKQEGNEHILEGFFDEEAAQGIVNGGHTYAQLIHMLHGDTSYSELKDLRAVLSADARKSANGTGAELKELVLDEDKLMDRVGNARERAQVQMEFVAPVSDAEMLSEIARARNLSQSVEATAFANLAGKFEIMKDVLGRAPAPLGPAFVERVVWKTNQEVPEDSKAVPVKLLIHVLSLMNTRAYPPATKTATEVYSRSGVVVREFSEAEGEDERHFEDLTRLLPDLIRLYDHIYTSLPEADPSYPWADGKLDAEPKRRRMTTTPLLSIPCESRVLNVFVWPIFAAFRLLIEQRSGELAFIQDPIRLFDDMKSEFVTAIQSFHRNQAHGIPLQVGKDKEIWVRLQAMIETELKVRERLAATR